RRGERRLPGDHGLGRRAAYYRHREWARDPPPVQLRPQRRRHRALPQHGALHHHLGIADRPMPRAAAARRLPADDRGRHCDRAAGAHSAQGPTAAGRVISTIWRVLFEREDLPCGAMDSAPSSSVSPKILESVGRHFGVPDRVLDVLVAEVVLQGPRVVAIIRQLEPAGMAKHVRVDRKWHLGGLADALDKPVETDGAEWPAALGNEYVDVSRGIAA